MVETPKCLSCEGFLDLRRFKNFSREGTRLVKRTSWSAGLSVAGDGTGVVAHAGSVATRLLADRVGLTGELSKVLKRRSFTPIHDRGRVLVDVAVVLADGGEAIADIEVLRHQAPVLGSVASAPTVWRALEELTPAALNRIQTGWARVRRRIWAQLSASDTGLPASRVADTDLGDVVVLDVNATIVVAHSEKERASATLEKTFGFHPLAVWCDNTEEFLAGMLRTTSPSSARRSPRSRPCTAGSCWSAATERAPATTCWTG